MLDHAVSNITQLPRNLSKYKSNDNGNNIDKNNETHNKNTSSSANELHLERAITNDDETLASATGAGTGTKTHKRPKSPSLRRYLTNSVNRYFHAPNKTNINMHRLIDEQSKTCQSRQESDIGK